MDAEMDAVTHSFKGAGQKEKERHQVVTEEECGVEEGELIFKMGSDVEIQMEKRLAREMMR